MDYNDVVLTEHVLEEAQVLEGDPITAERISTVLSRKFGKYMTIEDAYILLGGLQHQGLLKHSELLKEYTNQTSYPYFLLTEKGEEASKRGYQEMLSESAHALWLTSRAK